MKQFIIFIFCGILLAACQSNKDSNSFCEVEDNRVEKTVMARQNFAGQSTPTLSDIKNVEVVKKKIIKDGRLGIEVDDLEKAKLKIDTLVKSNNGYYANESYNNNDYEFSYNLKIRVPSPVFEKFISEIDNGDDKIVYKEIKARDVTEQFIDLESRLKTKQNYLKRYNELLKKAITVKDIIEIEGKIRRLEEEIESTTGRLKYLNDLVDYSSLDLKIFKKKEYKYSPEKRDKFSEKVKQAVTKGLYGLVDFILFLFMLWPVGVIFLIFYFLWKRRNCKRKKE